MLVDVLQSSTSNSFTSNRIDGKAWEQLDVEDVERATESCPAHTASTHAARFMEAGGNPGTASVTTHQHQL